MATLEQSTHYRNLVLDTFEATGLPVERTFVGGSGALALWGELNRAPNDLDICVDPLYFCSDALRQTTRIPNTRPQRVQTTFWTPNKEIELTPEHESTYFGLRRKRATGPNAPLRNVHALPNDLLDLDIHTTSPSPEDIIDIQKELGDLVSIANRKFWDEYSAAGSEWVKRWPDADKLSLPGLRVMRPKDVLAGKQQRSLFSGSGSILTASGRRKRRQDGKDRANRHSA